MLTALRLFIPLKSKGALMLQAALMIVLVGAFISLSMGDLRARSKCRKACIEEEQRFVQATREIQTLEEQQRLLLSSSFASEKRLRPLMMIRPGEQIIFIDPPSK